MKVKVDKFQFTNISKNILYKEPVNAATIQHYFLEHD